MIEIPEEYKARDCSGCLAVNIPLALNWARMPGKTGAELDFDLLNRGVITVWAERDLLRPMTAALTAIAQWTNIDFDFVDRPERADIKASIGRIDGVGGTVAKAYLPRGTRLDGVQIYDEADLEMNHLGETIDATGHETGHTFNIPHLEEKGALMGPTLRGPEYARFMLADVVAFQGALGARIKICKGAVSACELDEEE